MRISNWSSDVCSSDLSSGHPVTRASRWSSSRPYGEKPDEGFAPDDAEGRTGRGGRDGGPGRRARRGRLHRALGRQRTGFRRRSEECREGKEGGRKCRCRWSPYHSNKNIKISTK